MRYNRSKTGTLTDTGTRTENSLEANRLTGINNDRDDRSKNRYTYNDLRVAGKHTIDI